MSKRRVVVVAYPGSQVLDIAGPVEVFDTADRLLGDPDLGYRVEFVTTEAPLVRIGSGVVMQAGALDEGRDPIDTLLIPGGAGLYQALGDRKLVTWIAEAAVRSRRVASVCGGAFLLAEAGLLDGRRVTTHWAYGDELARRYGKVRVDTRPIFVRDGPYMTSAGVSTGIDMSLALVEEDHGAGLALDLARYLVLFFKRHGGQSQFSTLLDVQLSEHAPIRAAQEWILDNLERRLSVAELADQARMSPRNFARVFRREVGRPPAQFVEAMRINRARELLETTDLPVKHVARRCGFATAKTFFRAFDRAMSLTPTEYRHRFQALTPSGLIVEGPRAEPGARTAAAGSPEGANTP